MGEFGHDNIGQSGCVQGPESDSDMDGNPVYTLSCGLTYCAPQYVDCYDEQFVPAC